MTIKLSPEQLKGLPAPDSKGLIRVTAAIRLNERDGTATVAEINDNPVPTDEEEGETTPDDETPASDMMPSPGEVENGIYAGE